jgi:hypothetical protein
MVSWSELAKQAPKIAEEGRRLLYQHGVPLGYLATQRKDDGLRIHPVCPILHEGELWLLVGNHSPKRDDLLRNGRFALHAFPTEKDDEFMLAGVAKREDSEEVVARVHHALEETGATSADHTCFRLSIERALVALYEPRERGGGVWPPEYLRWQANR